MTTAIAITRATSRQGASWINDTLRSVTATIRINRVVRQLGGLNDRTLRDIGVVPSPIEFDVRLHPTRPTR